MAQRYRLYHTSLAEPLVLTNAPVGWDDLKYTVTRDAIYHGLTRTFSAPLKFVKEGKELIDNVISEYGFEAEINIYIDELNTLTRIWENKISGILNFDPEIYSKKENYTEVNFEDSVIHKKFKNRENNDVAYNRKRSINSTLLPGFASESHTVQLRGQNSDTCNATCIYPFEVFNRLIQIICDIDYNPLVSSVFGRTEYGYVENGKAAELMLTKGLLMRGFTLAGDELQAGETNINFKLKECFENYNKLFNLGLGTEYDTVNARWNFVIEDKNYFYQTTELFTLDLISNLEYSYEKELMIQKITTGYRKFTDENDYGLSEYNNLSEFVTPISISDTELNLASSYRADGSAFQIAIDNYYVLNEESQTDIDEDIFFVHSFDDSGTLKSVKNENFDLIGGTYGLNPILANIYISPARNLSRWGDYIKSSLGNFETGNIRFNKSEKVSDLFSQYGAETSTLYENRDIAISDLPANRFSGRKIKFEAPLTRAQINIITGNPYGLVKFWDYIDKVYNYGWIKEVSTDRVDKDTTWELWEVANLQEIANNLLFMDGDEIFLMDGSTTIKTYA